MAIAIETDIADLLVIQPTVFEDERGYFYESFNEEAYAKLGINLPFVQDNQSLSQKGVLRGLHFQNPPHAQGKLVRVIKGAVLDVVVDIRKNSATYGKHFTKELSEKNKTCLYVPPGFAHGFLTLENDTIFFYKCTHYYNKASEGVILWNDKGLAINWGIADPVLSEKDQAGQPFSEFKSLF
ncbi:MAG TPA: dTDP-4-dehydrorhamnose 3,5-epimerase [Bacteroidia bacterium]|nr:dTDP-4-dehydrorhamnose 3,5-epimerase [Bacteroidia bacterium]HRH08269.1 dTDP-4-dehydrorhamnose 3,5-epimerase [Bacteroidia bacterium]